MAPLIATESIYSVVLMAICMTIYFKTEELQKLSQHKGIKYFRRTFLFFAISYFFKFITRIIIFGFGPRQNLVTLLPAAATYFVSIYTSIVALFYLVYSISWKKTGKYTHIELFWHLIAFVTGVMTVFLNQGLVFVVAQMVLLIYGIIKAFTKKKKTKLYLIYLLLLAFWTLSIVDIFIPNMLFQLQLAIYLASIGLFSIILFKVLKSTKV